MRNSSPGCNTAAAARPRALARLIGVDVRFGPRRVLRDITLEVAPGDFWTLIGPNGAGKSTMLGLFNGLTPCSTGRAEYAGLPVTPKTASENRPRFPDLGP